MCLKFPPKKKWCFTKNHPQKRMCFFWSFSHEVPVISRGDVFVHHCEHPLRLLADGFAGQSRHPDLCASLCGCQGARAGAEGMIHPIIYIYIYILHMVYMVCVYIFICVCIMEYINGIITKCIMEYINGIITYQWGYNWDKLGYNIMWDSPNETSHILLKWSSFQWPKGTRISRYFSGIHLGAIANNHRCAGQGDIVTSLDEYLKNESNSKIYILFLNLGMDG